MNEKTFRYFHRTEFKIPQGVNAFDYSERINLIGKSFTTVITLSGKQILIAAKNNQPQYRAKHCLLLSAHDKNTLEEVYLLTLIG